MGISGLQGVPTARAPISPKEGCVSMGWDARGRGGCNPVEGVHTALCLWGESTENILISVLEGNSEILSCSLMFASARWCASVTSTFWNSLTAG